MTRRRSAPLSARERRTRQAALRAVSKGLRSVIAAVQAIPGVGPGAITTGRISIREVTREERTLYRASEGISVALGQPEQAGELISAAIRRRGDRHQRPELLPERPRNGLPQHPPRRLRHRLPEGRGPGDPRRRDPRPADHDQRNLRRHAHLRGGGTGDEGPGRVAAGQARWLDRHRQRPGRLRPPVGGWAVLGSTRGSALRATKWGLRRSPRTAPPAGPRCEPDPQPGRRRAPDTRTTNSCDLLAPPEGPRCCCAGRPAA